MFLILDTYLILCPRTAADVCPYGYNFITTFELYPVLN